MVKVGIVGPAGGDEVGLRQALEPLLEDEDTRQIIYLGLDGAATTVVKTWQQQGLTTARFLDSAAQLAENGDPAQITSLLEAEQRRQRLMAIRCLPEPPARAVEMLEKWLLLAVHDKALLDRDDISNARVILYGKAKEASFKRFGPRCFFTPGPLSGGMTGLLKLDDDGNLTVQAHDRRGSVRISEVLPAAGANLVVTS